MRPPRVVVFSISNVLDMRLHPVGGSLDRLLLYYAQVSGRDLPLLPGLASASGSLNPNEFNALRVLAMFAISFIKVMNK